METENWYRKESGEIRGAGPCETESGPEKKRTAEGDVDLVRTGGKNRGGWARWSGR